MWTKACVPQGVMKNCHILCNSDLVKLDQLKSINTVNIKLCQIKCTSVLFLTTLSVLGSRGGCYAILAAYILYIQGNP